MKNSDMPATAQSNQEIVKAFMDVEDCAPNGLSKREAFAMAAMQGILSSKYVSDFIKDGKDEGGILITSYKAVKIEAFRYADAMLKED